MKYKEEYKRAITSQDIAQELTHLSGEFGESQLNIGNINIEIFEVLSFKKALKIKEGEFFLDISIKGKIKEKEKVGADKSHKDEAKNPVSPSSKSKRPYEAKKIKKVLGAYWKELVKAAQKGIEFKERQELIDLIERYSQITDERWHQLWVDCAQNIKEILKLMEQGEYGGIAEKVNKVNRQIKSCHKLYK